MGTTGSALRRACRRLLIALGCPLALMGVGASAGATGQAGHRADGSGGPAHAARALARGLGGGSASTAATLQRCVTAVIQSERSATFAGEMIAISGSARMAMRFELQERTPQETSFHEVTAPGLGAWRTAEPGVKVYRYLKQVTNLSAPAVYRAEVSFRWQGARGRVIRRTSRRTSSCTEPAPPPEAPQPPGTVPS